MNMHMRRRSFFGAIAGTVAASLSTVRLGAQEETRNTTGAPMDQDAYKSVRLSPKRGPHTVLTDDQRDDLEHHIHCQCGCGLDVYTCRTTDFSCRISPAMHLDVLGLAKGGYNSREIIAAFRKVYGDGVLMEPAREGFNLLAYTLPFGALLAGGTVVVTLLQRWRGATGDAAPILPPSDATPEELARLRSVLRSDE
jgi:cytochrome c-type biogenesis protein CcmH